MNPRKPAKSASSAFFFIVLIVVCAACHTPESGAFLLDREYGFQGFRLGSALYSRILMQAKERLPDYEVLEYETFGSRFADQQVFEAEKKSSVFGAPVANVYAGVIDEKVYAFLLQLEADGMQQNALQDSLYAYYGDPQTVVDTTMYAGDMVVRIQTLGWEADSVGLEFGQGEGFAEILVYDKNLRRKRNLIQQLMMRAQRAPNDRVSALRGIGEVLFSATAPTARWRYRYRGELTHVRGGSFGPIDYEYVEPFFDVRGESLFGVQMAFVNLSFAGGSDSLRSIEVRFDNTQGQTVGFMDMLRVMERKLGRHAYSDTLHTRKGGYRRAMWYGDRLSIMLEENRFRPERPDRADVLVQFEMDRVEVPWEPPPILVGEGPSVDSLDLGNKDLEAVDLNGENE